MGISGRMSHEGVEFCRLFATGKTALLEALIPRFVAAGLRVSLLKHAHHHFDIDRPGKDSYRLREAGCGEVLLTPASAGR